jgi:hypothetical protein
VLYNGLKPYPADSMLKLSDAFIANDASVEKFGSLELTVRGININPDGDADLLHKSEALSGYSAFVERVRLFQSQGSTLRDAISEAVKWGIENKVLSSFLEQHGSEVENMLYTEFNIDVAKEVWQGEAWEDGRAEGEARGEAKGRAERTAAIARNLFGIGLSLEQISKATGLTREEIEGLKN